LSVQPDWLRFDDEPRRPVPEQPDPSVNAPVDLTGALAESPEAAKAWNKPTGFKVFPTGKHAAIIRRSEWRAGNGGRRYLFLVWQEMHDRRGCSLVDPVFLNAATQQGRQFALRKLSLIAAAAGIELRTESFQPSDLLGAVALLEIESKPHWAVPGQTVQAVAKYLPAPSL
jgi:hypothetical protein